jgi:hypothetical protein
VSFPGKGVTKDKLVQGCMRMRKLGDGHQVVFWASKEVDNAIRAGGLKTVSNKVHIKIEGNCQDSFIGL